MNCHSRRMARWHQGGDCWYPWLLTSFAGQAAHIIKSNNQTQSEIIYNKTKSKSELCFFKGGAMTSEGVLLDLVGFQEQISRSLLHLIFEDVRIQKQICNSPAGLRRDEYLIGFGICFWVARTFILPIDLLPMLSAGSHAIHVFSLSQMVHAIFVIFK